MNDEQRSLNSQDEEALPHAQLLRAKDLGSPAITPWQFADLEEEEQKQENKVRDEVVQQMRREAAPELQRQTTILKKKAYETAHQEGYDAGFQKGLELGKAEAKEQVLAEERAALSPKIEQIESVLNQLKKPFQVLEDSIYEQLISLSTHIAEQFLKQKIEADPHWILEAVKASIDLLPESDVVLEISLHPDDIAVITEYKEQFSENWSIKPTPDLPKGSCRVRQDFSVVEHCWKTQLADYIQSAQSGLSIHLKSTDSSEADASTEA